MSGAGRKLLWAGLLGLACADPVPVAREDAPPVDAPFVDRAAAWGLDRPHTGGGPDKRYIVEAKGGGAALLDVEGDGDLDIYLSLIHISEPTDPKTSRMPSSA